MMVILFTICGGIIFIGAAMVVGGLIYEAWKRK